MNRTVLTVALPILLGLAMVGCSTSKPVAQAADSAAAAQPADACSTCARGRAGETVWCDHCKLGFVAGKKMESKECYTAAAGGKTCDTCPAKAAASAETAAPASGCATCAKGRAGETVWCDHCKLGFVAGKKMESKECYTAAASGKTCDTCPAK